MPEMQIAVGIDTGRYGHHATFLRPDCRSAAAPLEFAESTDGYHQLLARIEDLRAKHLGCDFCVHIDAAGQYATNLETFLRTLPGVSVSIGEPERNKNYHRAMSPKRKTDETESWAMARFAAVERPRATNGQSAEFRALCEATARLRVKVRDVSRAINRLHNLLARVFPELATCVSDVSAMWVLKLLSKYPTPERISRARESTLTQIPHATREKVKVIKEAASKSVASLSGEIAESLVRLAVEEVQQAAAQRKTLEKLVEQAFAKVPPSGHLQLTTIPGVGVATAAVLLSKVVSIDRFESPEKLVGYFGVFPSEKSSGVDKEGNPNPSVTRHMSQKGNDLARAYLYSAAKTAVRCNPAVRSLYKRLRSRGKRHDVAMGHCMRKLLHLVFAVWSSNKPFNPNHHPWDSKPSERSNTDEASTDAVPDDDTKNAVGRNLDVSQDRSAVTTAKAIVSSCPSQVNSPNHWIDFAALRSLVTIQQVLEHAGALASLHPSGAELRGPCPIHCKDKESGRRHFAVNLEKNVFRCFSCGAQGNQLDLWAAIHQQELYPAALDLARTFNLDAPQNREEEPVK